jgi:hypothetical protein
VPGGEQQSTVSPRHKPAPTNGQLVRGEVVVEVGLKPI